MEGNRVMDLITEKKTGSLSLTEHVNGFSLFLNGHPVVEHTTRNPCIELGSAEPKVVSNSGFFKLKERKLSMRRLEKWKVFEQSPSSVHISFGETAAVVFELINNMLIISPKMENPSYNRFRMHISAIAPGERIFGGGEQLGKLNLRGKRLPVWISEPGVGRRFDPITVGFALKTGHVPRWFNTYYSMPAWVTSSGMFCSLGSSAYSQIDFRGRRQRYTVTCWEVPHTITIGVETSLAGAVAGLGRLHGLQPRLPDWVYEGLVLGIQGGTEEVEKKLQRVEAGKVPVTALWCQDWEGRRKTLFGSQLKWAWEYDAGLYPKLPDYIQQLKKRGIRFLGYNNTFLTPGSSMYDEAVSKGYVVTRPDGSPYQVYVPFDPAVLVDFTNAAAVSWLKEIIKKNMVDIGMSGWMADFGEMIPHDGQMASGESGLTYHNRYPVDWARINFEIAHEAGLEEELMYFMRAGFTGASRYTSMNWNGDQLVDWSRADGLPSAIMGSLTWGLSGVGYTHSDIGGYTTLAYKKRSTELLMRWAEYAAFTQMMRTHEGNRPENNIQLADDPQAIAHASRMVSVFAMLKPYHKAVSDEYQNSGLPCQRIPEMQYPEEWRELGRYPYQYLYGSDLLVAPVLCKGRKRWKVRLPEDSWVHLWSGTGYSGGGSVTVDAPIGNIPVFYKKNSKYRELFSMVGSL